jgi:hypothetical protein
VTTPCLRIPDASILMGSYDCVPIGMRADVGGSSRRARERARRIYSKHSPRQGGGRLVQAMEKMDSRAPPSMVCLMVDRQQVRVSVGLTVCCVS